MWLQSMANYALAQAMDDVTLKVNTPAQLWQAVRPSPFLSHPDSKCISLFLLGVRSAMEGC